MNKVIRLTPQRDNIGRFQSESKVWRNRAIVFGAVLAFFAWIYIGHTIETSKTIAFFFPTDLPNMVSPSYASGPVERDLPGIGPSVEKGQEGGQVFRGKASWYGHGAACMGCDANEIMANGEKFDELDYTLAMNHLPMNTLVQVENLDNGKKAVARVTDTGCFNQKGRDMNAAVGVICTNKLDRIADLSKKLGEELEFVPENSNTGTGSIIEIRVLPTLDRVN